MLEYENLTEPIIGAAIEVHPARGSPYTWFQLYHGLILNVADPKLEMKRMIFSFPSCFPNLLLSLDIIG